MHSGAPDSGSRAGVRSGVRRAGCHRLSEPSAPAQHRAPLRPKTRAHAHSETRSREERHEEHDRSGVCEGSRTRPATSVPSPHPPSGPRVAPLLRAREGRRSPRSRTKHPRSPVGAHRTGGVASTEPGEVHHLPAGVETCTCPGSTKRRTLPRNRPPAVSAAALAPRRCPRPGPRSRRLDRVFRRPAAQRRGRHFAFTPIIHAGTTGARATAW